MTVTAVDLKDWSGETRGGHRSFELIYRVTTDSIDDGPETVRDAAGIPNIYTFYNQGNDLDTGATLKRYRSRLVDADEHYRYWEVSCFYSTECGDDDDGVRGFHQSPLAWPVRWSGGLVQFTREYQLDNQQNVIKNSAGDPQTPTITGDDSRMQIVAERNEPFANIPLWVGFRDGVNEAAFWGFGPRTLKVQSISWRNVFCGFDDYVEVRYEFHLNLDTWDTVLLDAGYYERTQGATKNTRITERLGRDYNQTWPISATGTALTAAEVDANDERTNTYLIYQERNFFDLNLPAVIGGQ